MKGLLLYADMGGMIALTASGELIFCPWDSETVAPVEAALWVDVALASAAKRYPELSDLLPERPTESTICPICNGSGWRMDGRTFCGRCRGLGWLK
jgi:hypothetical protein